MYINGQRQMAWVVKIEDVQEHPNADALEICHVGGWKTITKKGEFKKGDIAVYISVDSWVPHSVAPFLSKGQQPKEYNGIKGARLRTIRLRGIISQGLLLSMAEIDQSQVEVGDDATETLGIQLWELPIPAHLSGDVKGSFPLFIPKTNQERIQNLTRELSNYQKQNLTFEVTEKLDGSSMTVYYKDGVFGVCSRNLELQETENNSLWQVAKRLCLGDRLQKLNRNIALQGELIGPGIQGNPYKLSNLKFFVFDVFDIDQRQYLTTYDRITMLDRLNQFDPTCIIDHAPAIGISSIGAHHIKPHMIRDYSIDGLIEHADGHSIINQDCVREGVVWKSIEQPSISFKVISNNWLVAGKD